MSTASRPIPKQQRRRTSQSYYSSQQSRNSNAYFDRHWRSNYYRENSNFYSSREYYPTARKPWYSERLSNRHRPQPTINEKQDLSSKPELVPHLNQPTKTSASINRDKKLSKSNSSTSSDSDPTVTQNKLFLNAPRQQHLSSATNLNTVQTLMNSLAFQQQPTSTTQLQTQLTNVFLATAIHQRLKEVTMQVQSLWPNILAAQTIAYQQQLAMNSMGNLSSSIAHPGTKFNNRPLVKFPIVRQSMPSNCPRHQFHVNNPSLTLLPTYKQVQEIERGTSLGEAIELKNAIDIAGHMDRQASVDH